MDLFVVLAMQQEPAELVAMVVVELAHHLALLNQMQQVVLNQAPRILVGVVVLVYSQVRVQMEKVRKVALESS